MAEEFQVKQENQVQQVTTKEPQQVTTENLKKVEAGKRLAEHNHRKREAKKREEQVQGTEEWSESLLWHWGCYSCGGDRFIEPRKEKLICHVILLSPNNHALSLTSLKWIKSILDLIKWTRTV